MTYTNQNFFYRICVLFRIRIQYFFFFFFIIQTTLSLSLSLSPPIFSKSIVTIFFPSILAMPLPQIHSHNFFFLLFRQCHYYKSIATFFFPSISTMPLPHTKMGDSDTKKLLNYKYIFTAMNFCKNLNNFHRVLCKEYLQESQFLCSFLVYSVHINNFFLL